MAQLHPMRLLKAYRGYGAGAVIHATDGLAKTLEESGVAVPETQTSFLPSGAAERAVESRKAETRGSNP